MRAPSADPILAAANAQLARLEATGAEVLRGTSYAALAEGAWLLHSVLYCLQSRDVPGAKAVDPDEIENLASLLERLRDEADGADA